MSDGPSIQEQAFRAWEFRNELRRFDGRPSPGEEMWQRCVKCRRVICGLTIGDESKDVCGCAEGPTRG